MNSKRYLSQRCKLLRGMTLIEVMIGMFCVVILCGAMFGIMGASMKINSRTDARTAAMWIANQKMEELCSTTNGARELINDQSFAIDARIAEQFPELNNLRLAGSYSIKEVAGQPGLQQLTVRVQWRSASASTSKPLAVEISSMVADRYELNGASIGDTENDVFVPPPPPPDPLPPIIVSDPGSSGGSSSGGSTGWVEPPPPPPADDDDSSGGNTGGGDSGGGDSGGNSGGDSGGSTGGGPSLELPIDYGGMWG